MLCQAMIGLDDESIIADYHKSESLLGSKERNSSAASMAGKDRKGKLSREIFSGSPEEVMKSTLEFIRKKYGSVNGYLDSVGFNSHWRERFVFTIDAIDKGNRKTSNEKKMQSKL